MITRRMFHTRLLAALALGGVGLPRLAGAAAADDDALWLNRLTFGATAASRDEIAALGRIEWLERQLALPVTNAALEARIGAARLRISYPEGGDESSSWPAIDEFRPLSTLSADPAGQVHLVDWSPGNGMDYAERIRPASEVISVSLLRAVHAEAQLREVMTQFWHDHFSVNSLKDEYTAAFFPSHDAVMRQHALGNFRDLLGEVARSPAMLYYLNNAESIASPANENYARELLELHTLGAANYLNDRYSDWRAVPGAEDGMAEGYLDLDVYEVARAFTGWTVGDGRWISEGENAPRTGRFHYVARWHDPYQKRVLGREFLPNRGPMEDGDEVLDILARHPGTARFVCEKIARRLLTDDPPPRLVAEMAEAFLAASDAPDQIAQVIRVLVQAPEFASPPVKLRRPFEFMVALYRAAGAEVTASENGFHWMLGRAGWRQHTYGPPTGHPDRAEAWTGASTLNRYVDIALNALEGWFDGAAADLSPLRGEDETLRAFGERQADALVPGQGEPVFQALAEAFGLDGATPARDASAEDRQGLARSAVTFAALTPEFLMR
ncbi:MAG: DUF1800 domain-containing protein [Tabrizicola sp.]|nr:DUF1800 domain-containing protein [Tabrizicola sp.]